MATRSVGGQECQHLIHTGHFSRFKTENRSLPLDCQTLEELTGVIARRIDYYNRHRRHSKIGYMAPLIYAETMRTQP